jgi:hypothetical protein
MNIYLSTSWKNRERVRSLALRLRSDGFDVYDFTDPECRKTPEIPPERFPEQFDSSKHIYRKYLDKVPEWRQAVDCNREAINRCDVVVLMLPCGNDAHADAYYGLGLGKRLIVCGQPKNGDRSPTHMWADEIVDFDEDVAEVLRCMRSSVQIEHEIFFLINSFGLSYRDVVDLTDDERRRLVHRMKEIPVSDPTELNYENVSVWANSCVVLEMGSEGPEVTLFEKLCNHFDNDYYPGKIDEEFGKGCRAAAQRFQQGRLLSESGVVDETTKITMLAAFEEGWHPGMTFTPPWSGVTQSVIGPWHPKLGDLPDLRLGKDEEGKMSTFGGPQDWGDRIYGQAYFSDAKSPQDMIDNQPELVEMGIVMDAASALAVRYDRSSGPHEKGDRFFNGDLSVWPPTTGPEKGKRAGESSMLNPASFYIAMRFKRSGGRYNERNPKLMLWCEKTQKACVVMRTDYGPHTDTGRLVDISPGAADALYLEPDDEKRLPTDSRVFVTWAPDGAPLGPVKIHEDE